MKKSTVTAATRKRADRLASQLRDTDVGQWATELAEWVRQSEALAKAQAKAQALTKAQKKTEALAVKAQSRVEDLAAKTQAKAETLAAQAHRKGAELSAEAQERGAELAERLGERLSESRAGKLLGIQQRRRPPTWLVTLLGVTGGCAITLAVLRCRRRAGTPLEQSIQSELTNDPRTAGLPNLRVNVANGTVFVSGTIPPGFNQETLREVITRVPGVDDVDLQLNAAY